MPRLAFVRCAGLALAGIALLAAAPAFAADPPAQPLPAWEQLSPAQREQLIAPVRERWNSSPEERQRMLQHARRWQQMSPEERRNARQGLKHWEHLNPDQRRQMRALYAKMRVLDEAGRRALMEQWRGMSEEQRRAWVKANPPPWRRDGAPRE